MARVASASHARVASSTSRSHRLAHAAVIVVEPLPLGVGQQAGLDAGQVDRRQGQRLELEVAAVGAVDLGLPHRDQVLDADAVGVGLVVARLVADDHAGLQGDVVGHLGDALRALVDREIGADAVAGAVVVVEPGLPQRIARQRVELRARGAGREARHGQRDVALEHAGEAVAHLGAGRADRHGAGDVGRAVAILAARIDEIEAARLERALGRLGGAVMHDGAVGAGAGNGVEAQIAQLAGLLAQRLQPVGRLDLAQLAAPAIRAPSQPRKRLTAAPSRRWARADALELDGVLAGLGQRHRIGVAHQRDAGRLQAGRRPDRRCRALDQHALVDLAQHVERGSRARRAAPGSRRCRARPGCGRAPCGGP